MQTEPRLKLLKALQEEFLRIKAKNPNYSLRAFSRSLQINHSHLSMMCSGRRGITLKTAKKIAARLGWSPERQDELLSGIRNYSRSSGASSGPLPGYVQLTSDQFHVIADWYHYAILSLAETRGFRSSAAWIAKRLGIQKRVAQQALDRLIRMQMLTQGPNGKLSATGKQFSTTHDITDLALNRALQEDLELAKKALETLSVEDRECGSMTMTFNPKNMALAKKLIREFKRNFAAQMEKSAAPEVAQLNIQFFPLTQPIPRSRK